MKHPLLTFCVSLCLGGFLAATMASRLRADELHLKDGSVIKGLIVSYDEKSLRVKTNYGFATVRRDVVVSIVMTGKNSAVPMPPGSLGDIKIIPPPGTPGVDAKNAAVPAGPTPGNATSSGNAPADNTAADKAAPSNASMPAASQPPPTSPPSPSNAPSASPVAVMMPSTAPSENHKPLTPSGNSLPSSIGSTPNAPESRPVGDANNRTAAAVTVPPPLIGDGIGSPTNVNSSTKPATGTNPQPRSATTSGALAATRPSYSATIPPSTASSQGARFNQLAQSGQPGQPGQNTAPDYVPKASAVDNSSDSYTPAVRATRSEPIREYIVANTYFNQTYAFKMYRPPEWGLVEAARAVLPGTIAALGTDDEKTYLLVGAAPATGALDLDMRNADKKLQEILNHYRPLNDFTVTISGFPAVARHFRGGIDQQEWSGVLVVFERGAQLYTALGMTQADTDLSQLEENIIQRVVTSIDFSK